MRGIYVRVDREINASSDQEELESELSSPGPLSKDAGQDGYVVDSSINDSDNPINWPAGQNWTIVAFVSTMSLLGYVETLPSLCLNP